MKIYDTLWQKHSNILDRLPHLNTQITEHCNSSKDVNHEIQYQQIDSNFNELSVWLQSFDKTVSEFKRLESKTHLSFSDAEQNSILSEVNLFEFEQAKQSLLTKQQPLSEIVGKLYENDVKLAEAWSEAKNKNTLEGYQSFLDKYPNSKFASEAKDNIEKLTPKNNYLVPLILLAALGGGAYYYFSQPSDCFFVASEYANIRDRASLDSSNVITKAYRNEKVCVYDEVYPQESKIKRVWYQVKHNGKEGWMSSITLAPKKVYEIKPVCDKSSNEQTFFLTQRAEVFIRDSDRDTQDNIIGYTTNKNLFCSDDNVSSEASFEKIKLKDAETGWVKSRYLKASKCYKVTNADGLNVRAKANKNSEITGYTNADETVCLASKVMNKYWAKIISKDRDTSGYINLKYTTWVENHPEYQNKSKFVAKRGIVPASQVIDKVNSVSHKEQTIEEIVKNIKKMYSTTQRNLNNYAISKNNSDDSEGVEKTEYYDNGNKVKELIIAYAGSHKEVREIFYHNDEVFFIFSKTTYPDEDTVTENRYYFSNQTLIKWLKGLNGAIDVSTSSKEFKLEKDDWENRLS